MAASVEELVQQVRSLPRDDQRRFRELLDAPQAETKAPMTEEQFLEHLLRIGMISEIKRPDRTASPRPFNRIQIEGEPLSETIIRERE